MKSRRLTVWILAVLCAFLPEARTAAASSVAAEKLDAARTAYDAEDWVTAATLYRELAADNPRQGRFWYLLGTAEYNRKRYREAVEPYERAAELGYQTATSHYNRGCCLALLGESSGAVDAIELAIRTGLKQREDLIRNDADLASIRESAAFQTRILPTIKESTSREEGWRIDLDYLTRRIEDTHYAPFRYISRADWNREIERISANVPRMKDHEIVVALMQLMVRINDGHTVMAGPREGRLAFHIIPVEFYEFKDGLFVRAAAPEYANLVGKRVVRVGAVPAREAMERVATTAQRDNAQQIRWMAPRYMSRIEVLDALKISKGLESVDITVADERGKESRSTLKPIPLSSLGDHGGLPDGWVDMSQQAKSPLPLWRSDKCFTLEYLEGPRVVYAGFCAVLDEHDETLDAFSQRVAEFVSSHPTEALVIDVRVNNGGNNFLARSFVDRVQDLESVNQEGKLFVITGRETFSACQNFCNWMDVRTEAMFVGEPTGSRPNFVGEGNQIVLPYSGLIANASSRYWQDSVSEDTRLWIAPDLAAEMTSDDYRSNRDPALEAILAYLKLRLAKR